MYAISATELARNTREILDRVSSQGETIIIQHNQTLIAQIVPSPRIMSATKAFEGLGLKVLSPEQSEAWLRDSKE
jgi:antitoxin (DNA-binding transcriptional repressor) of toxin-antitoxin stability system